MSDRTTNSADQGTPGETATRGHAPSHAEHEELQAAHRDAGQPGMDGAAIEGNIPPGMDVLQEELTTLKDKYLRLNAEFDNFRKRTAREKLELIQFAGENALKNLLPVLDDMERAMANNAKTDDIAVVKEGFQLILNKLQHILGSQGLKAMEDGTGAEFDTDRHEAITKAPAPSADLKGKVIDVVEKGYFLHDKVVRYAKVVVGE